MTFKSDNTWGVNQQILDAIIAVNHGVANSYGQDEYSADLLETFSNLFDCKIRYLLTTTGTAANSLALATLCPPYGIIYCHQESHINHDECSCPEMVSGGAKICPISGNDGKIDPIELEETIIGHIEMRPHQGMPACISITQGTECGTVYKIDEIMKIKQIADKYQIHMHMDGARFANAMVSLGCKPEDLTSRIGIDVISFGGTKNGALAAEAVIFLNQCLGKNADYMHKKMGQLLSKTRFFSAQFLAYLSEGLWTNNAKHANKMAKRLAEALCTHPQITLKYPCEINEVFAIMPAQIAGLLEDQGVQFYCWSTQENCYRFVTSFQTNELEIELVFKTLKSKQAKPLA